MTAKGKCGILEGILKQKEDIRKNEGYLNNVRTPAHNDLLILAHELWPKEHL